MGDKVQRLTVGLLAALLACNATGEASAQTSALLLGGKGNYANLSPQQISSAFGGYFAAYTNRVSVPFPGSDDFAQSTKVGADNLYAAVYASAYAGPKTIGGVSEGAPAVFEVLRRLEADRASGKTPPPTSELNVAVYGMPSGPFLGGYKVPQVISPYDIIIVKAEYDGIADFPTNPLNLLAVANALMGADQLHVKQANFDIRNQPTEYTVVTNTAGGTTTTILIPTAVLPILAPMLKIGASPASVAAMDKLLRPIIDSAYKRPKMTVGIPPTLTGPPGPKGAVASTYEVPIVAASEGGGTPAAAPPSFAPQATPPATPSPTPATTLRTAPVQTTPTHTTPTPDATDQDHDVVERNAPLSTTPTSNRLDDEPTQNLQNGAVSPTHTTTSHPDADNGPTGAGSSETGGGANDKPSSSGANNDE